MNSSRPYLELQTELDGVPHVVSVDDDGDVLGVLVVAVGGHVHGGGGGGEGDAAVQAQRDGGALEHLRIQSVSL